MVVFDPPHASAEDTPRAWAFRLTVSALGAVMAVTFWNHGVVGRTGVVMALFAPAAICSDRLDRARRRRAEAEEARAREEWSVLSRDVAAAVRTGVDVDRLLRDRGYTQGNVRRWILHEAVGRSP